MEEEKNRKDAPTTPPPAPLRQRTSEDSGLGQEGMKTPKLDFSAWQMAWELGYTIAIPIVLLALLGRWAGRYFQTSPWLLLLGILISISFSSFLVYRKVKDVLK